MMKRENPCQPDTQDNPTPTDPPAAANPSILRRRRQSRCTTTTTPQQRTREASPRERKEKRESELITRPHQPAHSHMLSILALGSCIPASSNSNLAFHGSYMPPVPNGGSDPMVVTSTGDWYCAVSYHCCADCCCGCCCGTGTCCACCCCCWYSAGDGCGAATATAWACGKVIICGVCWVTGLAAWWRVYAADWPGATCV